MSKRTSHPILAVCLWFCFLGLVFFIAYLSFQNGEETKAASKRLIAAVVSRRYPDGAGEAQITEVTYEVRQLGRMGLFFLAGILGTITVLVTFQKFHWLFRMILSAGMLCAIAVVTEKGKNYIESRHYSYDEMMLSIAAAIGGFLLVSFFQVLYHMIRSILHAIIFAMRGWRNENHDRFNERKTD